MGRMIGENAAECRAFYKTRFQSPLDALTVAHKVKGVKVEFALCCPTKSYKSQGCALIESSTDDP